MDVPTESIECEVENMFAQLEGKGTCVLSSNTNTYITVYTYQNESFAEKFSSLETCFGAPKNPTIPKPADLAQTNTIWIELLLNGSDKKGFGKKLFKSMMTKAKSHGYKYVFLYPSASLTNQKVQAVNQDTLVSIYQSYGLKKLNECTFHIAGETFDKNVFDSNAPYHLMFGSIDELTLGDNYSNIPVNYKSKYLKYKAKYLALKKQFQ